jgi:uroporphyrinogen decarboxylase
MNSREKIRKIFERNSSGETGFWTGSPHPETVELYKKQLHVADQEGIFQYLNDDCRHVPANAVYLHPEGRPPFDTTAGKPRLSHSQPGCFAECTDLGEVAKFPWPNPEYLDFDGLLKEIGNHPDKYILSGLWSPFFHRVSDFFGMENYFTKMYTDPEIVEAVTDRVVDFFVVANDRLFAQAGDKVDAFFFGNDFGSQLDLLISPEMFEKFVLPGFRRLIAVAKRHEKKVLLHSCGSIYKVIPDLIEAGIDALHPLQAKAANMDAVTLAREFKNDIAFVGGVDTQALLVHATPEEVKEEVGRLRGLLGPNWVVSPSHEALLPNVPLANVIAMAQAARE